MEKDAKDERGPSTPRSVTEGPRLAYVPREDATPDGELSALAAVYQFVIECAQQSKAAEAGDEGENSGGEEA
jgi:hypothetical protein